MKAPKAYAQVTQIIDKEPDTDIIVAEKRVLGITHQEVGYMLARRWQLPDVIAHVILRHHQPERAGKFRGPATLVYLADTMSRALGLGSDGDDYMRPLRISAARWKKLKLKLEDLEVIMKQTSADHSGFEDFYSTGTDS